MQIYLSLVAAQGTLDFRETLPLICLQEARMTTPDFGNLISILPCDIETKPYEPSKGLSTRTIIGYESFEEGEGMHCLNCGSDNPEGVKFCIECAAPFPLRCPSCGADNIARAKFCGECATPLIPQPRPPVSSFKFQVSSSQPLTPNP